MPGKDALHGSLSGQKEEQLGLIVAFQATAHRLGFQPELLLQVAAICAICAISECFQQRRLIQRQDLRRYVLRPAYPAKLENLHPDLCRKQRDHVLPLSGSECVRNLLDNLSIAPR